MNKSLRSRIEELLPEKISNVRKEAQDCAESDFIKFSESIQDGQFWAVDENEIGVTIWSFKMSENKIWRAAYVERISQLFGNDNLKVTYVTPKMYASSGIQVHLKICEQSG